MSGKGGYQAPANPAAVSGPGKFARRTDGGPSVDGVQKAAPITGLPYGENGPANQVAQAAPLAAAGRPAVVPLSAPSQRPDEPVTDGAPVGPGRGVEAWQVDAAPVAEPDATAAAIRAAYAKYPSPYLRMLVERLAAGGR